MSEPIAAVAPADWRSHAMALRDAGYTMLDFVTGIDRGDEVEVIARLVDPQTARGELFNTRVSQSLDSLTPVLSGAAWHERETREMFGIEFDGLADARPLLLRDDIDTPPLRKTVWLAARSEREWPGAAEPEARDGRGNPSRRRLRPPGVPDDVAAARR